MTNKLTWLTSANVLKFAAVLIAAPRYVGAFGVSLGVAATELYPALVSIELATGGAMAILEGFAIAFMVNRWAKLKQFSWQWLAIATIAIVLLFTLPLIGLPYLLTEQRKISTVELFTGYEALQIAWSLVVLSVPVLIIIGVALADYDTTEQAIHQLNQDSKVKLAKLNTKQVVAKPEAKPAPQPVAKPSNGKLAKELIVCDCGRVFDNVRGLNGHKAHCKMEPVPVNGNGATK